MYHYLPLVHFHFSRIYTAELISINTRNPIPWKTSRKNMCWKCSINWMLSLDAVSLTWFSARIPKWVPNHKGFHFTRRNSPISSKIFSSLVELYSIGIIIIFFKVNIVQLKLDKHVSTSSLLVLSIYKLEPYFKLVTYSFYC